VKGADKLIQSAGEDELLRIVNTYSRMLLHIASSRLRNASDAEDAVQDVFLTLVRKSTVFGSAEHEKAWLIRCVINRANDMRRKSEAKNVPLDEAFLPQEDHESSLLEEVRSLPDKYACVIHLYYYEGYSIAEIAKILHLPSATVGTRLARARKLLK